MAPRAPRPQLRNRSQRRVASATGNEAAVRCCAPLARGRRARKRRHQHRGGAGVGGSARCRRRSSSDDDRADDRGVRLRGCAVRRARPAEPQPARWRCRPGPAGVRADPALQSIPLPLSLRALVDSAGTALLRDNDVATVMAPQPGSTRDTRVRRTCRRCARGLPGRLSPGVRPDAAASVAARGGDRRSDRGRHRNRSSDLRHDQALRDVQSARPRADHRAVRERESHGGAARAVGIRLSGVLVPARDAAQ